MHFFNTHSHIHNFLVLVAGTTLLHLFVLTHIYFISTATSIELRSTITKVILIPVVRGKSYLLLLCSLLLLMVITKHYSTYTLFTSFVSKTVFYITNSSQNQNQVENTQKRRRRTSEESTTKNARIRFSTKEFKVNTQQVLSVSALTVKLLRPHRPSRVASCLPDWVPESMAAP